MSKNYSVDDILAEVKHKKEQEGSSAKSFSRADELVEEILLEKSATNQHSRQTMQDTKMFPAAHQKEATTIKEETPKSREYGSKRTCEEFFCYTRREFKVEETVNTARQNPVEPPIEKKPVYESVKSRNAAGHFTTSFRRIDTSVGEKEAALQRSLGFPPEKRQRRPCRRNSRLKSV